MVEAHSQVISLKLLERWPDHKPRKGDPNYKYFRAAKKRLKAAGLLKCVVDSEIHAGQIELHHDKVEYAHINDVDIKKFNRLWGLSLTDKGFVRFVEEEGNLEPLCTLHHRGIFGVHSLPEPEWNVLRTSKQDHEIIRVLSNKGGVFVPPKSLPLSPERKAEILDRLGIVRDALHPFGSNAGPVLK